MNPAHPQSDEKPAKPVDAVAEHHREHCRKRCLAEGSSLYYALLFTPEPDKTRLLGLSTLIRDVQQIPFQVQDANIARIKLAWWKTETEKTAAGSPSHPATHCLGQAGARALGTESVPRLVQAVSEGMNFPRHFTQSEWDQACLEWGGESYLMAARVLGSSRADGPFTTDDASESALRNWGASAMRLTQLLMLGKALGQGWHPFPVEVLQQAGVSLEMLRQRRSNDAFVALSERLMKQSVAEGERAWRQLPKPTRLALRPLRALWRMRAAEARLAAADGYPLLTQRLGLTPIRKLWISWTTHALRR